MCTSYKAQTREQLQNLPERKSKVKVYMLDTFLFHLRMFSYELLAKEMDSSMSSSS